MMNLQTEHNADARVPVDPLVRAFRVECAGIVAVVFSQSPGKARYAAARSAHDAGYLRSPNPAEVRCTRAPEFDGRSGVKPGRPYGLDYLAP